MAIGKRDPKALQEQVENHRDNQRLRQYKAAKLIFNDDQSVIDCVLRDLSPTGARVRLGDLLVDCPQQLVLKISDGVTFSADVMWHRNNELGLQFHGEVNLEIAGKLTSLQGVLDQTKALPMDELLRTLDNHRAFDDDAVKDAGQEFAAAYQVLIESLRTVLHREEEKNRKAE